MNYANLFAPLTVRRMALRNRIVMMPMGTNYAREDGGLSDAHIHYYEQRARGGTGLIVVENICVDFPLGSNGTTQLRLDHDRYIPGMARLCEAIHRHGSCASVQINHAGASALSSRIGMQPVSASDLPSKPGGEIPRPLAKEELEAIARKFGDAASRARQAGFDAVEFHAGHSYLGSQFLSPTTNRRTDEFGGCAENRARFPRMVMEEIRAAVGEDFPIFVRLSLDEFAEGGNTIEDSLGLMEHFCEQADVFSVSAGLNSSLQFQIDVGSLPDGWRSYMAKAVRERFGKPVITMGNIRSPQVAEDILARGDADLIGIGRGLIAEPEWANKVRAGRLEEVCPCISCNIGCAGNRIGWNLPIRCTVNPAVEQGEDYAQRSVRKPCNVVVIGGGVAGLEAACTAAEVGCTAVILERSHQLGGLSASLSKVSEKHRIHDFIAYQVRRASRLKQLFALTGTEATVEKVAQFHPDIIVNATGSQPRLPDVEGLREALEQPGSRVFTIAGAAKQEQVCAGDLTGKRVAIAGGGAAGVDAIEFFARRGAQITIVEQGNELGGDIDPITRCHLRGNLEKYPVDVYRNTRLAAVEPQRFRLVREGKEESLAFDYAYICLGMDPDAPLLPDLWQHFRQNGTEIVNIGNSARSRRMIDSIREGREILAVLERCGYFHG